MRISRIYLPNANKPGSQLALPEGAHAHLVRVLRLGDGAPVEVFNGRGERFSAQLANVSKRSASLTLLQQLDVMPPSPLTTHLGLAMSKGDRMDIALQKATELGVSEITPLSSERCDLRLKADRRDKKQHHWQGVIISACEQCGQDTLPVLNPIASLQDWINNQQQPVKLVLHTTAQRPAWPVDTPESVAFLVGPEGGLTDQEVSYAQQHDFQSWQLGQRILRTETAPLAMLAILQHRWGDLS
jgi:16S rRNA (uracil1498-N3)-methyltransferase